MTFLTDSDLAYLQAEAQLALPDKCNIEARSQDSDGQGGMTENTRIIYPDVPCRFALRGRGYTRSLGECIATDAEWVVALPFAQHIEAGMDLAQDGRTYNVQYVLDAQSHSTVRRCFARRVG